MWILRRVRAGPWPEPRTRCHCRRALSALHAPILAPLDAPSCVEKIVEHTILAPKWPRGDQHSDGHLGTLTELLCGVGARVCACETVAVIETDKVTVGIGSRTRHAIIARRSCCRRARLPGLAPPLGYLGVAPSRTHSPTPLGSHALRRRRSPPLRPLTALRPSAAHNLLNISGLHCEAQPPLRRSATTTATRAGGCGHLTPAECSGPDPDPDPIMTAPPDPDRP